MYVCDNVNSRVASMETFLEEFDEKYEDNAPKQNHLLATLRVTPVALYTNMTV